MRVFLYSEILKEENVHLVKDFISDLLSNKIDLCIYSVFKDQLIRKLGSLPENVSFVSNKREFSSSNIDYVITLGGDGTILKAIQIIEDQKVPIIGVNMGRLGFLSSVEKHKMPDIIPAILNNNIQCEPRTLLRLNSNIPIFKEAPYALNDFTLHKRDTSSMVTIHVYINDKFLNSYWADGIIVATPTGSTGYSLSCGGPIVFPESGNFVITPIAPHNLNVRPLIISDTSKLRIHIEGRSENYMCTLDSKYETITSDHEIIITKNNFDIVLATLEDIDFMRTIRNKLMWGLDKRN